MRARRRPETRSHTTQCASLSRSYITIRNERAFGRRMVRRRLKVNFRLSNLTLHGLMRCLSAVRAGGLTFRTTETSMVARASMAIDPFSRFFDGFVIERVVGARARGEFRFCTFDVLRTPVCAMAAYAFRWLCLFVCNHVLCWA